jgi:hypothetical protein
MGDYLMQAFDPSAIIGAGVMMMLLLAFIIFMLWQKLERRETEGLDLESYKRLRERRERLAGLSREQKRTSGGETGEEADADSKADMVFNAGRQ